MSEPTQNQSNNTSSPRRRSSGVMPAFDSLQQQKRGGTDATRRQSLSDQQAKGGIFHTLFHNNLGRNAK
ncbi:hypothetical protein HRG_002746 [Hirsutella rhossiliensis]|uniref:Conidiation-specific protein 8 n=1 Tax=Hirsutella rhossiliensis TaxID=111463 RepID=A0A9P8N5H6_9HYPO|nr:uncharacterized protein HRG_02746 [Hirsutella rhossiliensis]KAH0967337.1 hypothetical protein HRG_02746 [Hirsutella rhossiliensis]